MFYSNHATNLLALEDKYWNQEDVAWSWEPLTDMGVEKDDPKDKGYGYYSGMEGDPVEFHYDPGQRNRSLYPPVLEYNCPSIWYCWCWCCVDVPYDSHSACEGHPLFEAPTFQAQDTVYSDAFQLLKRLKEAAPSEEELMKQITKSAPPLITKDERDKYKERKAQLEAQLKPRLTALRTNIKRAKTKKIRERLEAAEKTVKDLLDNQLSEAAIKYLGKDLPSYPNQRDGTI